MTSLTRAKNLTRTFAVFSGIAFALFLVFRISLTVIELVAVDPSSQRFQEAPTLTFGQIDAPRLPRANVTTDTATLELDLVDGNFPQSTSTAVVYKAADSSLSLSARDRARARATNLGFTSAPQEPTTSSFLWKENNFTLDIDLSNLTFELSRPISTLTFNDRQEFSRFSPIGTMTSQFIQSQFQYPDLQYDAPNVQFVNPVNSQFIPQSSTAIQPTNYAQITFTRKPINEIPIYSSAGKFGPISMVIIPEKRSEESRRANSLTLDQIVQLNNNYIPIQISQSATYPLLSPQLAYQELEKNLNRYLVSISPFNSDQSASSFINGRVLFATLVYLEPDQYNPEYVQPAWMFEGRASTDVGNAQWIAYVPAINRDLVENILLNN